MALATLAVYNLVQNTALRERGYVVGNLLVTAGLLALGRQSQVSAEDIGLTPGDQVATSLVVGSTLVTGASFLAMVSKLPVSRSCLRDGRVLDATPGEAARRALVRFPLGTALFEEVGFRGLLPPLLAPDGDTSAGDLGSAAVFALWHLIPTHRALAKNEIAPGRAIRFLGTLAGAASAGVAGYALSRVRRRTGSLLAPWVIHSVVNGVSYMGVVLARGDG